METIHKFEIIPDGVTGIADVTMDNNAKILKVNVVNSRFFVWAQVNTESSTLKKQFEVIATGEEMRWGMGTKRKYIDTVFMDHGFVFHIYERLN